MNKPLPLIPFLDFDERPLMKERFLKMGQRIAKTPMDPRQVALWQQVQLTYAMAIQAEEVVMEEFDMVTMRANE